MGYTTRFAGRFDVNPPFTVPDFHELRAFAEEDHRNEPSCPGAYCQWVPSSDGRGLEWDGGEKFYNYVEWLCWLIADKLGPRGYVVSGSVKWAGEDAADVGTIVVDNNNVTVHAADKDTIQVFVRRVLVERYADDGEGAEDIAAEAFKSARAQGLLP